MVNVSVDVIREWKSNDLADMAQATEDAIGEGIGFNWVSPPMRETLEAYWRGVTVVPERVLIGARLDGTLAGSIQLVKPSRSKETSAFCAHIEAHFVAPWARGHGMAKALLEAAEREAARLGFSVLRLSVRETQERAMTIYREQGYKEWGKLPYYEFVNAQMVAGYFFYKRLEPLSELI